jgi:hypothetical protein
MFKSTFFINDQNLSKLNRLRANDVELLFKPTLSFGFQLAAVKGRHTFLTEFCYGVKEKQAYSYNVSGRQHVDLTELKYVKLNLIHRSSLFTYKNSNFNASVGAYLSNLKGISFNSSLPNANHQFVEANNWNAGLVLGLGQEHVLYKNVMLDYGIRNEIGLSSVFKDNSRLTSKTNLLGFAAYMTLKYRFH